MDKTALQFYLRSFEYKTPRRTQEFAILKEGRRLLEQLRSDAL